MELGGSDGLKCGKKLGDPLGVELGPAREEALEGFVGTELGAIVGPTVGVQLGPVIREGVACPVVNEGVVATSSVLL